MDGFLLRQLTKGNFSSLNIFKETYIPELFSQTLVPGIAQQLHHERVYVSDLPAFGIKQQDSIGRGFKESPVASFGCVQIAFGLPAPGNVAHVALDHFPARHGIDVAHKLDLNDPSLPGYKRQIFIADVFFLLQFRKPARHASTSLRRPMSQSFLPRNSSCE